MTLREAEDAVGKMLSGIKECPAMSSARVNGLVLDKRVKMGELLCDVKIEAEKDAPGSFGDFYCDYAGSGECPRLQRAMGR